MTANKKPKKPVEPKPPRARPRAPVLEPAQPSPAPTGNREPLTMDASPAPSWAVLPGPAAACSNIGSPGVYLDEFRSRFPNWASARLVPGAPVYCLPEDLITHLVDPSRLALRTRLKALLELAEAEAERAFTRVCRAAGAGVVGFHADRPVRYDLFADPPPPPTRAQFDDLGWGRAHLLTELAGAMRELTYERCLREHCENEKRAAEYRQGMVGWVGWLMFDAKSTFRTRLDALRAGDERLGGTLSWPFRPAALPPPPAANLPPGAPDARACGTERGALLEQGVRLVWDHQLLGLASWDLPEPQGPLEGVPVGVAARVLDPGHRVPVVPAYGNRPNDERLAQLQRRLQQANACSGGLPRMQPTPGIAGRRGSPSAYATAFKMWFL